MGWNGAGAVGAGKAAPPPSHPAWPPAQRPPSAQMAPHLSRQRGRGAGGAVPGGGGGGGPGRARCGARGAEGLCPPAPSRHPRGAPGDSCRIPLLGGGSRTPHPSHHPPHLGTPSPRPAPASPLPPQPSATSGPAVRAGGREERGGEPGQLPAGGARPLQHMCCHSAVPAVIVAPGRGCAMGPPLLLACLLAPLCARVRDGAGGWGALRWCWGERWGGGCGARAPMDALSRGRRGWGFGGTVAFLTL